MNLDKPTLERLCANLRKGGYRAAAAEAAGISARTLRHWLKLGRAGQDPYVAVLAAVRKAEREAEQSLVAAIRKDKSWQSKAWLLERRYPRRFGKRDHLTADVHKTVEQLSPQDDAQRIAWAEQYIETIRARRGAGGGT